MKLRLFHLLTLLVIPISLLGNALIFTPVRAASIVVNSSSDTVANDGFCTLREAITSANGDTASGAAAGECAAGSGADTITFTANYTITLVGSQLPTVTTTMTITGNGTVNTIIQANVAPNIASYRVLEVSNTGNLTINDLTIRHGNTIGDGGGIQNGGTLTVNDSQVTANQATTGSGRGAGISNTGTLIINDSTISNNTATFYEGGGIYNTGSATITDSIVSGNTSLGFGGGVSNWGTLIATATTFSNNGASISGGAINNTNNITISKSVFKGNFSTSGDGGGIANFDGTTTISNSTMTENSAATGGAIYSTQSAGTAVLTVTNSTISGNTGGGGVNVTGSTTFTNTIISNNTSGNCTGTITNGGNNIDDGTTCGWASASGSMSSTNPMLVALTNNGGLTETMALQTGSPAIDTGNTIACSNAPVGNRDQRDVIRPIDGNTVPGAICDIGAFEYGAEIPLVIASNPSANAALTSLSSITIVFNQDMLDNATANGAENVNNYILVERGANGSFDTTSCAGGVVSDDTPQTISTASYNSAGFITTLNFSPLAAGTYRLFVCGTTSIFSAAGLELNNGASDYTVDFTISATTTTTGSSATTETSASALPKTGFAPNKITSLPVQPATLEYAELVDLWIEIPSLSVKSSIVGVPQNADKTWDVTWLGNDTGWLNGTAFPTWTGNSVLTAHVTNASGLDGPFAALKSLKYGDQIIVHMGGMKYVYEVRNTRLARPYSTSFAFESKQDASYLTLITCSGYNPLNESYLFRRVVRAVLVEVK